VQFGFYKERLLSVVRQGKAGAEEIAGWMDQYRNEPFKEINGVKVVEVLDYLNSIKTNIPKGEKTAIDLPASNVMQFVLEDGTKITARPSGTEPKIKYYFSVKENLDTVENYSAIEKQLDIKLDELIKIFN